MYKSLWAAALFIAIWNIISVVVEYAMLLKVYNRVPELAVKETKDQTESKQKGAAVIQGDEADENKDGTQEREDGYGSDEEDLSADQPEKRTCCAKLFSKLMTPYRNLIHGWKTYRRQKAFRAGLGLAALYLTVLGFNSVTNGYLYTQGLTEWQVSIAQAVAAAMGITGTLIYPKLRKRVGLVRSGLIAMTWEWLCLLLPAASVFAPGNPTSGVVHHKTCDVTPNLNSNASVCNTTTPMPSIYNYSVSVNSTNNTNCIDGNATEPAYADPLSAALLLLLIGTLASRIGLWGFDCAVTQIYQETVPPNERGIVGGVQKVLNSNMDMLHFVLVIALPNPSQFGYLVLVSVAMVGVGLLLYASYSHSVRGHLFHFDRIVRPCRHKQTAASIESHRDKDILMSGADDIDEDTV